MVGVMKMGKNLKLKNLGLGKTIPAHFVRRINLLATPLGLLFFALQMSSRKAARLRVRINPRRFAKENYCVDYHLISGINSPEQLNLIKMV